MDDPMSSDKLIPKVYDDLLRPAVQEVGGALHQTVRAALTPVRLIARGLEEAMEYAGEKVEERLKHAGTPPERVRSPAPEIVEPVVRMLQYSGQDPSLQEMYLNLLARAMDTAFAARTHPAFVDMLRQLSPSDAESLEYLPTGSGGGVALIEARHLSSDAAYQVVARHLSSLGWKRDPAIHVGAMEIDSLVRAGILAVFYDRRIGDDKEYALIRASDVCAEIADRWGAGQIEWHEYGASVTHFGAEFLRAVLDASHFPQSSDDESARQDKYGT